MREVHTLFRCMGLHMRQPLKWLHMREYRSCNTYVSQHHGIVPDTSMRIQLLALVSPAVLRTGRQGRGSLSLHGAYGDEGHEELAASLAREGHEVSLEAGAGQDHPHCAQIRSERLGHEAQRGSQELGRVPQGLSQSDFQVFEE